MKINVYGSGEDGTLLDKTNGIIKHGAFNPAEVNLILEKVKVLLLPSKHEGFSFVAVEALSNGVPVIIADSYLNAKYLINSSRGKVLSLLDEKEWLNSIKEIYSLDSESYKQYSINCLKFAHDNLSSDDFKIKWINLINSLSE